VVGELEGIAQQIDQHLHEAVTIAVHPFRQVFIQFQVVIERHALHTRAKQLESVLHHAAQLEGFRMDDQLAGLQLRVIQDVVDHRHQMIGRLARVVEHLERFGPVLHAGQQQGIEAQNRVHRRAQLMAHGANEIFAHLQGVFERLTLTFELSLVVAAVLQGLPVLPLVNERHDDEHARDHAEGEPR